MMIGEKTVLGRHRAVEAMGEEATGKAVAGIAGVTRKRLRMELGGARSG